MISFVRVDNRLIHGQVVEAWLPHLKVNRVVVADDDASGNALTRMAMRLAVPSSLEVRVEPVEQLPYGELATDPVRTLLLVKDVGAAVRAKGRGLPLTQLNLGNVHFSPERKQISPSVFLSLDELNQLKMLSGAGVEVEIRTVPSDRPLDLEELADRFGKE